VKGSQCTAKRMLWGPHMKSGKVNHCGLQRASARCYDVTQLQRIWPAMANARGAACTCRRPTDHRTIGPGPSSQAIMCSTIRRRLRALQVDMQACNGWPSGVHLETPLKHCIFTIHEQRTNAALAQPHIRQSIAIPGRLEPPQEADAPLARRSRPPHLRRAAHARPAQLRPTPLLHP
jgi:hypothetical protein